MCPFPFFIYFCRKENFIPKTYGPQDRQRRQMRHDRIRKLATALAKVLTENEPSIGWYVRNPEVLESLRDKGRNPRYLSNVRFDRTRINPRTISTGWFPRPTSSSWPAPRPT